MGDAPEREISTRLRGLNLSWTWGKEYGRVKGHASDTVLGEKNQGSLFSWGCVDVSFVGGGSPTTNLTQEL